MAKKEVREVWIADDGKEFISEKIAREHEEVTALTFFLESDESDLYWDRQSCTPEEVARTILSHYNLTPKTKA